MRCGRGKWGEWVSAAFRQGRIEIESSKRLEGSKRVKRRVGAMVLLAVVAAAGIRSYDGAMAKKPTIRNVLLIVVDTLRADRVGCYGYTRKIDGRKRSLTPNIDRFAERGVLFENCLSQSSWTPTSMASMLYTIYPTVQSDFHSFDYLAQAPRSSCLFASVGIANLERDYDRINVQTNPYVLDSLFTSIFDHLVNATNRPFRDTPDKLHSASVAYANAAEVNQYAFDEIDRSLAKGRNFIAYLHYMDVHEPYLHRKQYRSFFADSAKPPADYAILRRDAPEEYTKDGRRGYDREFARRLKHLSNDYDAALMYYDDRFADLIEFVESRGLFKNTMIVLAADHGQAFGEHGLVGHGSALYNEQIHVPLVIVGGGMPRGARVRSVVSNVDIFPTIGQYIGLPPASDGASLYAVAALAAAHGITENREVYACADYTPQVIEDQIVMMVQSPSRMKYILTRSKDGRTLREELYDIALDPLEGSDLSSERPDVLEALRKRLDEIHNHGGAPRGAPERKRTMAPAVRSRLKALGYLQ